MNVYPVNAIAGAGLYSPQKQSYALLTDLHNRYLENQVDFNSRDIQLEGNWSKSIPADVFIIANTNAISGTIKFYLGANIVWEKSFELPYNVNIITSLNEYNLIKEHQFERFVLTLHGNEYIKIGYIYIGKTWVLPRFIVNPKKTLQLRNEAGRSFGGQVIGIPIETLRDFAVQFVRIKNQDMKKIDDYINGVQTVIPHVIDPYSEAHEEFEPLFVTISEIGEKEKRAENGFFWNFSMSWQEAK